MMHDSDLPNKVEVATIIAANEYTTVLFFLYKALPLITIGFLTYCRYSNHPSFSNGAIISRISINARFNNDSSCRKYHPTV